MLMLYTLDGAMESSKDTEDESAQLQYIHNLYLTQYSSILEDLERYSLLSESFSRSSETVEKIKSVENASILLGIDAGSFIEVKSGEIKSIITSVGAGYMVEKNIEDALAYIKANAEKSKELVAKLTREKEKLEREIVDIEYKIAELQQR